MIKICEQFYSLQGEGAHIGTPSYFIRLAGCPFTCSFCDSKFTWSGKTYNATIDTETDMRQFFMSHIYNKPFSHIVFTGGEPLQEDNLQTLFGFIRFIDRYSTHEIPYMFTIETTLIPNTDNIKGNRILNVVEDMYKKYITTSNIYFSISPKFNMCAYKKYPTISKHDVFSYYSLNGTTQLRIESYFKNSYYKFVYTNETSNDISFFISHHVPSFFKNNIFIMPVTSIPYDKDEYNSTCVEVAEFCKREGIRYSSRLHVDLWGLMKGV